MILIYQFDVFVEEKPPKQDTKCKKKNSQTVIEV